MIPHLVRIPSPTTWLCGAKQFLTIPCGREARWADRCVLNADYSSPEIGEFFEDPEVAVTSGVAQRATRVAWVHIRPGVLRHEEGPQDTEEHSVTRRIARSHRNKPPRNAYTRFNTLTTRTIYVVQATTHSSCRRQSNPYEEYGILV